MLNENVTDDWCRNHANVIPPSFVLPPHSAPLDIKFYYGTDFPSKFFGNAFVSFHGSLNTNTPRGYSVERIVFDERGVPKELIPVLKWSEHPQNNTQVITNWKRFVGIAIGECIFGDCVFVSRFEF